MPECYSSPGFPPWRCSAQLHPRGTVRASPYYFQQKQGASTSQEHARISHSTAGLLCCLLPLQLPLHRAHFFPIRKLRGPCASYDRNRVRGLQAPKHVQWVPLPRGCSWQPLVGLLRGESERWPNCRPDCWASKPCHTRGSSVQHGCGAMKN